MSRHDFNLFHIFVCGDVAREIAVARCGFCAMCSMSRTVQSNVLFASSVLSVPEQNVKDDKMKFKKYNVKDDKMKKQHVPGQVGRVRTRTCKINNQIGTGEATLEAARWNIAEPMNAECSQSQQRRSHSP